MPIAAFIRRSIEIGLSVFRLKPSRKRKGGFFLIRPIPYGADLFLYVFAKRITRFAFWGPFRRSDAHFFGPINALLHRVMPRLQLLVARFGCRPRAFALLQLLAQIEGALLQARDFRLQPL